MRARVCQRGPKRTRGRYKMKTEFDRGHNYGTVNAKADFDFGEIADSAY
jgi:hypothetical protein